MASKCASKTLFVGNLHASLEESDLLEIFKPFGRIVECCKRWCHYGFIQFATEDEAKLAFNNLNGSKVRGRPMRIEFQRKKLRNIQALLEAEAEAKVHLQFKPDNDKMNFFSLNSNIENINPINSCISLSSGSFNEIDEDMTDSAEIEKCLLKVFDEILVEDNVKQITITQKKETQNVLKSINITNLDNMKNGSVLNKSNQSSKNDLKILENLCYNNSLSSSCSSPLSQKDDISPKSKNTTDLKNSSVRLFRSINSSNTIYVQPTDIIIPLSEGDYNEYKLFPLSEKQELVSSKQAEDHPLSVMNKILNNLGIFDKKGINRSQFYNNNEELELYSPPISSASSVSSCSNSSSPISSPSSTSPIQKPLKYLLK